LSEDKKIISILKKHEKRISDLEKLFKSKSTPISGEGAVLDLINSGFFDKQKTLGKMKKELKVQAKLNKGVNYTKILEKLTSENKLTRKMVGHQWVYQKNGWRRKNAKFA